MQPEMAESDQTRLIRGSLPTDFTIPAISRFIILKVVTLLCFFLSLFLDRLPTFTSVLVLTPAAAEFWVCKNWDGLSLVGMRWSHEVNEGGDPTWVFYSRRDPYVPEPADWFVFWAGVFGACLVWGLVTLIALPMTGPFASVRSALVLAAEAVNAFCFQRCSSVSYTQADDVARLLLFGDAHDSEEGEPETLRVSAEKQLPVEEMDDGREEDEQS
jgi:hypothetical protein